MASADSSPVRGVGFVVKRRIPKRHDAVAHVFVDRPTPVEDHVGHRGEEPVDQFC